MVAILIVSLLDRLPFERADVEASQYKWLLVIFSIFLPPIAGAAVVEQLSS